MNPFDLNAPYFLLVYVAAFVLTTSKAFVIRRLLRGPRPSEGEPLPALRPYDVAYLAGGEQLAIQATLACLLRDGKLYRQSSFVPVREELPISTLSADLLAQRQQRPQGASCDHIRQHLIENGLLLTPRQALWARLLPAGLLLTLALVGAVAVVVGLLQHRPVGVLVYASTVTVLMAVCGFGRPCLRTRRGDAALEQLRLEHADLAGSARRRLHSLSAQELILAVGLFGPTAVAVGPLTELLSVKPAPELVGSSQQ